MVLNVNLHPCSAAEVVGELMEELTKTELAILDLFEDDEYTLTEVEVVTDGSVGMRSRL